MKIASIVHDSSTPGRLLITFDTGVRIWTSEAHLRDRAAFVDTVRAAGLLPLDDVQLQEWGSFIGQFLRSPSDGVADRMDRSRVGPWPGELSIR